KVLPSLLTAFTFPAPMSSYIAAVPRPMIWHPCGTDTRSGVTSILVTVDSCMCSSFHRNLTTLLSCCGSSVRGSLHCEKQYLPHSVPIAWRCCNFFQLRR